MVFHIVGSVPSQEDCLEGQFTCGNGKCILDDWMCNSVSECGDHSDENDCKGEG